MMVVFAYLFAFSDFICSAVLRRPVWTCFRLLEFVEFALFWCIFAVV